MDWKDFEQLFRVHCHFDQAHGVHYDVQGPGDVVYTMTVQQQHLSSPGIAHGGAIAGMMDGVLGMTALSRAIVDDLVCSTIELKVNFTNPAHEGDQLEGRGNIRFDGKGHLVVQGEIKAMNRREILVALGVATFNLYPLEKRLKRRDGDGDVSWRDLPR